jgi:hypothetical protein
VQAIVKKALLAIPSQSVFYQCIDDVIQWHATYPDDWKRTWFEVQRKYDADRVVPQGVWESFNIDAHLNAAYVVIGLLYGAGDFTKTLEIATRCGQDSDCNPATAAGILGTIFGYNHIPSYWKQGLVEVEGLDFKYTTISLNKAYDLSYRHALEMIKRNGGKVANDSVSIALQTITTAPLEVSHPGVFTADKYRVNLVLSGGQKEWSQRFAGTGMAIVGRVEHQLDDAKARALQMEVQLRIDGKIFDTIVLPALHIRRRFDPFFVFDLPPGMHEVQLKVVKDAGLQFTGSHFISYDNKPYHFTQEKREVSEQ